MDAQVAASSGKVRVEGRASRWVPADFADVSLTVSRRAVTSADAVALAGDAYAALDAALRLREPRASEANPFGAGDGMAMEAMAKLAPEGGGDLVLVDLTNKDVKVVAVIELVVALA